MATVERFAGALHGWLPVTGPLPPARAYWRCRLMRATDGDRFLFRVAPVAGVAS
jgi:hypothetical protein